MKHLIIFLPCAFCLFACLGSKVGKNTVSSAPTTLEASYYASFNGNQARLHQLMLGTFVAHAQKGGDELESWTVTETDSVVLYSCQIGDVAKIGYWVYSYEFMTSLPNNPIYTTVKQIVQKDRDTFEVHYYKSPVKITLINILEKKVLDEIDVKTLEKMPKVTVYHRIDNTNFIGYSEMYEDKDCKCLRRNSYDVSPLLYKVDATFYSLKDRKPIQKRNRPNVMVRRLMDKELLLKIAKKDVTTEGG